MHSQHHSIPTNLKTSWKGLNIVTSIPSSNFTMETGGSFSSMIYHTWIFSIPVATLKDTDRVSQNRSLQKSLLKQKIFNIYVYILYVL